MTAFPRYKKPTFGIILGIALVTIALIPATARADLIYYASSAELSGTKSVALSGLDADIEYAVYAAADFNNTFLDAPLIDPSLYVYAYQVFNTGNDNIAKFTIGLDKNSSAAGISELNDPGLPSGDASVSRFAPSSTPYTSATWTFGTTSPVTSSIPLGEKSKILYFTSPYEWQWLSATVKGVSGNGVSPSGGLPSPAPEPAAPLCMAIAAGWFLMARAIRRIRGV
jgi:hypothetical protein